MAKPTDLAFAETIEQICTRYHCTPGAARREPVSTIRHMRLLEHRGPFAGNPVPENSMEASLAELSGVL